MIEIYDYYPFHTRFAEYLFEDEDIRVVELSLHENYYISEQVDVNFDFENLNIIDDIRPNCIYFDTVEKRFIISLDSNIESKNLIPFGELNNSEIEKINMKQDKILFRVK